MEVREGWWAAIILVVLSALAFGFRLGESATCRDLSLAAHPNTDSAAVYVIRRVCKETS